MLRFHIGKADTRPPKPKSRVRGAARAKRVDALARRMQRVVALDLYNGLITFRKKIKPSQVQAAWQAGSYEALDEYIPWREIDQVLITPKSRLRSVLLGASSLAIEALPPPVRSGLRWDLENPAIRQFVDRRLGERVRGITDETREHIREAAARSFRYAETPRDVAQEIVDSIGLHKQYRDALRNYRFGLIQAGKPADTVEKLSDRYRDQLLKARSMNIARSETRRAANHGQRSVWREAGRQGLIDPKKARRVWVVDGNPCEICEPLDGAETTLEEPFPGGLEPGDAHTNCECVEILEVD